MAVSKQTMNARGKGRASRKGNTRSTGLEQYYTPRHIVDSIIESSFPFVSDPLLRPWIDPAAGSGSFSHALKDRGLCVAAYDIEPRAFDVVAADFLSTPLSYVGAACITNPPFGRNNSLSVPFFNKLAAEGADIIGFVVPRSWRKWSVTDRLDMNFHCVLDEDLAVTYVDDVGNPLAQKSGTGQLRTVFQLWRREFPELRRSKVTVEDRGYVTKSTPVDADISMTVFGRGCGRVVTDFDRSRKNTTQMYLKLRDSSVLEMLAKADLARFYNNTAFVEALSIKEIRFALNEIADQA